LSSAREEKLAILHARKVAQILSELIANLTKHRQSLLIRASRRSRIFEVTMKPVCMAWKD
jgi:hypothetical protein